MTMRKVALITGGGSGIGAALARHLLETGWQVAISGRDAAKLEAARAELGGTQDVLTLPGDAAEDADVRRWVEEAVRTFGRLDAVVANAGLAAPGWLEEARPDAWREMILTNVLGPALLIHHAQEALTATRGRVVLVGSIAGLVPTPGNLYGATKYAMTGLAENTRRALTDRHVGVTLIAPGRVESPFWDDLGGVPDGPVLGAEDLGRATAWVLNQPDGVDVNTLTVRPFESAV